MMANTSCHLDESKVTWEMGLWACLWRFMVTRFIGVGRSTHNGWPHSLRSWAVYNGGSEFSKSVHHPLLSDFRCNMIAASRSCYHGFPAKMDGIFEL